MFITNKEWRALSARNKALLLQAVARKVGWSEGMNGGVSSGEVENKKTDNG